ncbi:MAG: uroporphyrinogen decarboxylase [Tepidanaerobacteraceae bacterium]|jgi:hypothetical protein|nr:uroporphyrinogen decarboxylase [Tepidanaerobacteraceae bacterium]
MTDAHELQRERISIYHDVYDNKIPKRVPVDISLTFDVIAQFGGLNLTEVQWNPALIEEAVDRMCQIVYSDRCIYGGSLRYPSFYQILKAQSFQIASNGFIQHPEVVGMLPEDYDYLIENPYDCILERIIPRQYKAFNLHDPINCAISFAKSILAYQNENAQTGMIISKMVEKYGYYPGGRYSGGFTEAPFDFLADMLRGFKGISMDIRRMPEKVAAACDALYPIVFKRGLPSAISNYGDVFIPLHMAPFMREKDFATLWWPSFKRMVDEYASMGIHCRIFCERDWTRYLDYLYELPTDTRIMFEYGDPKLIKEKLGKKHIIMGLYPIMSLKTKTKQECMDEAKRYIDALAPGGKYLFGFDKNPLFFSDIKLGCLCAVTETVRDYAVYSNAGETAGMVFNKEDYKAEPSRKIESKYYKTWEEYKAQNPEVADFGRQKLQGLEETIFNYFTFLLM